MIYTPYHLDGQPSIPVFKALDTICRARRGLPDSWPMYTCASPFPIARYRVLYIPADPTAFSNTYHDHDIHTRCSEQTATSYESCRREQQVRRIRQYRNECADACTRDAACRAFSFTDDHYDEGNCRLTGMTGWPLVHPWHAPRSLDLSKWTLLTAVAESGYTPAAVTAKDKHSVLYTKIDDAAPSSGERNECREWFDKTEFCKSYTNTINCPCACGMGVYQLKLGWDTAPQPYYDSPLGVWSLGTGLETEVSMVVSILATKPQVRALNLDFSQITNGGTSFYTDLNFISTLTLFDDPTSTSGNGHTDTTLESRAYNSAGSCQAEAAAMLAWRYTRGVVIDCARSTLCKGTDHYVAEAHFRAIGENGSHECRCIVCGPQALTAIVTPNSTVTRLTDCIKPDTTVPQTYVKP